jgi:DNA modification methylase
VKDRFTVDYEEMFFFTKSKRYYFEQQFVTLDPETEGRIERFIRNGERFDPARHKSYDRQGGMTMMDRLAHKVSNGEAIAANMRTVWTIPTARCTDAHFAVYPEELIRTPILAGCPKGGIVLDPFCGAGTTAIVCEMLGRSFLGIELNPAYVEIAKKRIRAARETIADEAATKGSGGISHEPKPQGTRGKRNHPSDKYPNDDWGKAADWDQTPEEVCRKIIGLITWAEGEFVLEPFRGDGNFYRNLPAWVRKDWCEIKEERDFFEYTGPSPDTIITNPPYRDKAGGENLVVPCLERCLQLARKRVIYFVNHKVFNALTATRMKKYGEWNWGITHLSVWDMKKWPGRYYLIIWEKDKPSIIDYSLATKSEGAADGK